MSSTPPGLAPKSIMILQNTPSTSHERLCYCFFMMKSFCILLFLASRTQAFVSPGLSKQSRVDKVSESSDPFRITKTNRPVVNYRRRAKASIVATTSSRIRSSVSYHISPLFASFDETCDVLVLGSGPAGRAVASLLSSRSSSGTEKPLDVLLADQNLDKDWVPNYGVWRDEWDAVVNRYQQDFGILLEGRGSYGDCLDREWPVTDCFFGGSFDIPMEQRLRLDRPYCRVDRFALRQALLPNDTSTYRELRANHVSRAIGVNLYEPAGSLVHDKDGTTITLQQADGSSTTIVRTKLVVDTTGHETKLVLRDTRAAGHRPPGFQIAYGALVELDETDSSDKTMVGPYDKEAMTLFDYRTDHFDTVDDMKATKNPTFMYVMPLKDNKVFFEETSLVARPAMSFEECKDRCFRRIEYLGMKVKDVEEEEYCYIPMGGGLPVKDQRVIGLGGAAAMVHPSTGYHLCRMLMGASDMAKAIQAELSVMEPNLDRAAASAYHSIWTPEAIRQRNFAVFGGEFLMAQDVVGLRGFFDGFFALPMELWAGFLAGWKGLPNNDKHESWASRMWFGLNFIIRIPAPVALSMLWSIISYSIQEGAPLPQSVTPLLGEPQSYEYKEPKANVGDVAAKAEARRMIQEAKLMDVPVDFDKGNREVNQSVSRPLPADLEKTVTVKRDDSVVEGSFQ